MNTVMITGASGFIGSHLTAYFLAKELNVIALFNTSSIKLSHPRLTKVQWNMLDQSINSTLKQFKPDVLIHTAALNPSVVKAANDVAFSRTNLDATVKLAEDYMAYSEFNVASELKLKFINLSTYEIYGTSRSAEGFKETDEFNPASTYAASKAESQSLLEKINSDRVNFTSVVCSNNYGPFQSHEKLIPAVMDKIYNGQAIDIYGDGSSKRTWTYINDTCEGIYQVFLRGLAPRYHLCSNQDRTVKNIIDTIHHMMVVRELIENKSVHIEHKASNLNPNFQMNAKWSERQLKWSSSTNLESGLAQTITAFTKNLP